MQQTREQFEAELAKATTLLETYGVLYAALKRETKDSWRLSFVVSTQVGPCPINGTFGLNKSRVWTAQNIFEDIAGFAQRCRS
jgi:hypothetical protein